MSTPVDEPQRWTRDAFEIDTDAARLDIGVIHRYLTTLRPDKDVEGSTEQMHPNAELVRRETDAWDTGDVEAVLALYTPEAVYHYPGSNPLSGDYRGHDGIREYFRKCTELIAAVDELDGHEHDVIANDEHAVRLLHIVARKNGRQADWRSVAVYHFLDGKLDHVWVHVDPQRESDDFLTYVAGTLGW